MISLPQQEIYSTCSARPQTNPLQRSDVRAVLILMAAVLIVFILLFALRPISLTATPAWVMRCGLVYAGLLVMSWFYTFIRRGPSIAHPALATLLILLFTLICAPVSYAVLTFDFPLADPWLARADALLGVHLPAINAFIQSDAWLRIGSVVIYETFLPQIMLIILLLGMVLQDYRALWEFIFHFQFTAVATVFISAFAPARGVFEWYGYTASVDQTRFIAHFNALRDGSMTAFPMHDLEGMISFPSFHTAAAVMMAWSMRGHPRLFWPFALLNAGIVASTVTTGSHYVIDLPAAFAVCGLSIYVYSQWVANPSGRFERRSRAQCH